MPEENQIETGETETGDEQNVDTTSSTQESQTPESDATDTGGQTAVQASAGGQSADEAAAAAEAAAAKPTVADAINEAIAGAGPKRLPERNPDGTFKSGDEKKPEQKAETDEEKAAHEAAEAEAAKKKPDAVDAPIPDEIKGRTRERMQELIETVKAQRVIAEQHESLFGAITATGATPDEFAAMISYLGASHSNDPARLEAAYKLLQAELRGISIRLGKPVPEVNLLTDKDNADLVEEVKAGKLTAARAHEIALGRAAKAAETAASKRNSDAKRAKDEDSAAVTQGRADLDRLDGELRERDGEAVFLRKANIVIKQLDPLFQRLNPANWYEVFKQTYEALPDPGEVKPAAAVARPQVKPAGAPRALPQRPTGTPAGSAPASAGPKNALEAINQALEGF